MTLWQRIKSVALLPNFFILMFIGLLVGICGSFFGPYLSLFIVEELQLTSMHLGIYMAVSTVFGVGVSMWLGRLSDFRLSRKHILMMTTMAGVIGFLCYVWLRNYFVLLFVQSFFIGIAQSDSPQVFSYAREMVKRSNVPDREIPFALNVLRTFFSFAWTFGPALAGFVLWLLHFEGLFLSLSVLYFINFLLVLVFLQTHYERSEPKQPVNLFAFMRQPHIIANAAAFLLFQAGIAMALINLPLYIVEELGGAENQVGLVFGIPPLFEIPFMIWFGLLAARFKTLHLIRVGAFFSMVYYLLLFWAEAVWHLYPVQILHAVHISIFMGVGISYFQEFIPDEPGTATTFHANANRMGAMFGFLAFGFTADRWGYEAVFLLCAICMAVSFYLLLQFGENKRRSPHKNVTETV